MTELSRRDVLRRGATAALVAAATVGFVTAAPSSTMADPHGPRAQAPADPRDFEENYKGKKIKGEHDKANGKHKVHINGKKLGVMQIELPVAPDSTETYTAVVSTLNHFDPIPLDEGNNRDGLKKLAKLAVDQLGDQELTHHADHTHR
ncbi:tyrosinase family oxidase copper chaperone [Saccharothrix stipae]